MKFKIYYSFVLTTLLCSGAMYAQYTCPSEVGYRPNGVNNSGCQNLNVPGFFMVLDNYFPPSNMVLTFENSSCNGTQQMIYGPCYGDWGYDIVSPYCTDESPTGIITFPQRDLVCHYTDGVLDAQYSEECYDLLQSCGDKILEYTQNYIPNPPDCKLWEGPCATESEIWRNGAVIIGASAAPSGFKLGVEGGIMTEMVQICKAEWCDFVFSDTFNLMKLSALKEYIQSNKHLPGCTSSKTIESEGGFLLEEQTLSQQQKLEEVFLHLIGINRRVQRLDKKLKTVTAIDFSAVSNIDSSKGVLNETISTQGDNFLLQIECFQIKPASSGTSTGVGGVLISPFSGPYNLQWTGPSNGSMVGVNCEGLIKINGLAAGVYQIVIKDASGALIGNCSFTISNPSGAANCSIFTDPECKESLLSFLEQNYQTPPDCKQWEGKACSHEENIHRLGNVSIGTQTGKAGYSLAVSGGIASDRLRVELCETKGWCDYVFEKDYPLLTLDSVEAFIKKNKHLPESISEAEVLQNEGFELRSVKLDHQKKIEEAFLHLIALNNKKKELQLKLEDLKSSQK
jgi:hypothetical protein